MDPFLGPLALYPDTNVVGACRRPALPGLGFFIQNQFSKIDFHRPLIVDR